MAAKTHEDTGSLLELSALEHLTSDLNRQKDRWVHKQPEILLLQTRHPPISNHNSITVCSAAFLWPEQELNKYCNATSAVSFLNRLRQMLSTRPERAASDSKQNKEGFNSQ